MKSLRGKMSPTSWLCFDFACYLSAYVLFHPSLVQFLILILVDSLALALTLKLEPAVIHRFVPGGNLFFPTVNKQKIWEQSLEERRVTHSLAQSFPLHFATYCVVSSLIKCAPAYLVMFFFWRHDTSHLVHFLKLVLTFLTLSSYFFGGVFIECHRYLSKQLNELELEKEFKLWPAELDFSKTSARLFRLGESLSLLSVATFLIVTQLVVVTMGRGQQLTEVALNVTLVGIAGLAGGARIWYLYRQYVHSGLETIFGRLENFEPGRENPPLALHSDTLLGFFKYTVNGLMARIKAYRQELSSWILIRAESSRFRAIGEISALVVHDLSGPLHTLSFCLDELKADPSKMQNAKYWEQMEMAIDRSEELVQSLRSYLRPSKEQSGTSDFTESLLYLRKLLETQYFSKQFERIELRWPTHCEDLFLEIPRPDLIHILWNMCSNSTENLLSHSIETPWIEIQIESASSQSVVFALSDNGTGLGVEQFERLTGDGVFDPNLAERHGLGLRLTRRLIEHYGGKIKVGPLPEAHSIRGTRFLVELPRVPVLSIPEPTPPFGRENPLPLMESPDLFQPSSHGMN